jgi:hypothetical protein
MNKFAAMLDKSKTLNNVSGSVLTSQVRIIDPRPDLSRDSILWQQLLTAANDIDYRLFGALLCMRRAGTGIVRNPNGGLRLYPHIAKNPAIETDRWASLDEYDRLKGEILAPVAEELFKLMGKIVA